MSGTSERVKTVSYDQVLKERFNKDPQEALDYLNGMLEAPEEPELFLIAIERIAKAFGMTELANQAGFGRDNIYKTLSEQGHPTLKNLLLLLDAMGLQMAVVRKIEQTEIE
jgi:probable addiction module antidote protein